MGTLSHLCCGGVLVLFLIVVSSSSCSEESARRTEVSAPRALSSAADVACRSSAKALCDRAIECSPKLVDFFFGSPAFCETDVFHACAVRYEGASPNSSPASCDAAAKTIPCEQFKDLALLRTWESAEGQMLRHCPITPGTGKENDGCYSDGDCESGLCARATEDAACGICVRARKEGEECVGQPPDCVAPLRCDARTCIRLRNEDEPCPRHSACAGGVCGADGHCSKLAKLAEHCDEEAGPTCDRGIGLTCDTEKTRTCQPFTIVKEGEACDNLTLEIKPSTRFCIGSGSRANCVDGRCVWLRPFPRAHRECTSDGECVDPKKPTENALCINHHCTVACKTSRSR